MQRKQLYVTLVVTGKDIITYVLPPMQSFMLGRDESANDIVLHHPNVSRTHCRLVARPDGFIVADVASTKGTYVNDEQVVGQRKLRTGDVLRIGPYVLRVAVKNWTHKDEDDLDVTLNEMKIV